MLFSRETLAASRIEIVPAGSCIYVKLPVLDHGPFKNSPSGHSLPLFVSDVRGWWLPTIPSVYSHILRVEALAMTSTPSSYSTDMLTDDLKTKLVFFGNEFPNDDLRELFRRLQRHSKDKRFPFLSLFLEECSAVIKDEAAKLPQHLQELIPPFHTVLTLADHGDFRRGPLGAAMESALLCVLEIGMLIGFVGNLPLRIERRAKSRAVTMSRRSLTTT